MQLTSVPAPTSRCKDHVCRTFLTSNMQAKRIFVHKTILAKMEKSRILLVLALRNTLVNWAGPHYGRAHIRIMFEACSEPKLRRFKVNEKSPRFPRLASPWKVNKRSRPIWNIKMTIEKPPLQQYAQTRCPCTQEKGLHLVVMFFRTLSDWKKKFIAVDWKVPNWYTCTEREENAQDSGSRVTHVGNELTIKNM